MGRKDSPDVGLDAIFEAASLHGIKRELYDESDDLAAVLRLAWGMMDEDKRRVLMHSELVQGLLSEWGDRVDLDTVLDQYPEQR